MQFKIISLLLFVCCFFFSGCEAEKQRPLSVGDKAPDFTALSLEGDSIRLFDWKGSPVILRFWSTNCKYCRADTPVFNHYFERYKEKGLRVLYINSEEEPAAMVKQFVKDLAIPFPVIMEGGRNVSLLYNVKVVPQTIFIDPQGVILTAILGGVGEAELEEILDPYLLEGR